MSGKQRKGKWNGVVVRDPITCSIERGMPFMVTTRSNDGRVPTKRQSIKGQRTYPQTRDPT